MIYESYHLVKQSPTAGLFFTAEDYLTFLSDLKGYLNSELTFLPPEQSRWRAMPQVGGDRRFGRYPVGRLVSGGKAVELFFLHYTSPQQAAQAWDRRRQRICWDRLLIKMGDQNRCTPQMVKQFWQLPFAHKVFFTCRDWPGIDPRCYLRIPQVPAAEQLMASREPFGRSRYLDVTRLLNTL